jgi:hypothetical protein
MNLIFDLWVKSEDKVHETKIFCKNNYKVIIIIGFLLHQSIISKMFIFDALLNIRHLLKS